MRAPTLFLFSALVVLVSCQSSTGPVTTTTDSVNSSSTNPSVDSSTFTGFVKSSESSGVTDKIDVTTSASLNLDSKEKLVNYTTKQKTIFIACCAGTCVLLIALAVLSGMSDTVARSRQKALKTHA